MVKCKNTPKTTDIPHPRYVMIHTLPKLPISHIPDMLWYIHSQNYRYPTSQICYDTYTPKTTDIPHPRYVMIHTHPRLPISHIPDMLWYIHTQNYRYPTSQICYDTYTPKTTDIPHPRYVMIHTHPRLPISHIPDMLWYIHTQEFLYSLTYTLLGSTILLTITWGVKNHFTKYLKGIYSQCSELIFLFQIFSRSLLAFMILLKLSGC